MQIRTLLAGTTLALATLATPVAGQQSTPPAQPQLPDSIQSMLQEFQDLRAHVSQVQDSALQSNPELVEARDDVQEFIESRMIEINPDIEEDMARMEALRDEVAEAQAAQDRARLQSLMQEGQELRNELAAAQTAAMQRDDVQARVETFEERMMTAMVEIDAEIEAAFDRMETLAGRLQAFQQGG